MPLARLLLFALAAACAPQLTPVGLHELPAPTGAHATGRTSFHWQDPSREELETRAADDKRELMVHVFYPAESDDDAERASYMPDADAMGGAWNEAQVTRIAAMRAFSRESAPIAPGPARYPVVVFAPGGGMKGLSYHALCEDLASHGYVVAAIDPPYNARAVRFPDGRVLGSLQPGERGWPAPKGHDEELRYYRERVVHWSRDISFVIDQLTALDRGSGPFAQRLDLERGVGVAGHSRGGQAAGAVRILDARVRGGINLDGTAGEFPVQPVRGDDVSGAQPFLWIQGPLPPPPTDQQLERAGRTRAEYESKIEELVATWHRRLESVSGGALRVCMDRPGLQHIDFSDEPFWDGSMTPKTRPGKLQTIADTRVWMRSFFDGTLRGEWTELKRLVGEAPKPRGELTVHAFGRMWP